MDQGAKRIDLIPVQQDVHLCDIAVPTVDGMVVKRGITPCLAFQLAIEIEYDLGKGHFEDQLYPCGGEITLADEITPLEQAKGHDIADIFRLGDDLGPDIGFFDPFDARRLRHLSGIVDDDDLSVTGMGDKTYVGDRGDDGLVELPFQPFLDDLHMQHAQKSATEAEAKRLGSLQFIGEGGVIELQFIHAIPQFFKMIGFPRENAREYHRFYLLETLDHLLRRIGGEGEGVPYPYFLGILYPGYDISDNPRSYLILRGQRQFQHAHLIGFLS